MPKTQPRYSLAVQRSAVEQVLHHHTPIAQVARKLRCSDQSIQRWIKKHRNFLSTPTTFLPVRVKGQESSPPSPKIELVTKTGLTLRFPVDTPSETLIDLVRSLEDIAC